MCIRGFIGPSRTLSVLSTLGDCAGAEAFLIVLPFVTPLRTLVEDRFFGMCVSSLISISFDLVSAPPHYKRYGMLASLASDCQPRR